MKIFRTQRFLCNPIKQNQDQVTLTGDTAHHLFRVLRLKIGDKVCVFDHSGREWDAEIVAKKKQSMAEKSDYKIVKTGPRLLRTETAPIMALSILQYLYGDFVN